MKKYFKPHKTLMMLTNLPENSSSSHLSMLMAKIQRPQHHSTRMQYKLIRTNLLNLYIQISSNQLRSIMGILMAPINTKS